MEKQKDILFDVATPLGFHVKVSRSYWQIIVSVKHPAMAGHEKEVKAALEHPEEIRRSKQTPQFIYFTRLSVKAGGCARSARKQTVKDF